MPRESFHQELRVIEESVIQMATLVESAIARSVQALTRRESGLAEEVVAGDANVNELQRSIRNHCISLIALQAPVARDLRELITVQLVINELERMGDHAVGIARQAIRVQEYESHALVGDLSDIATLVREQVRDAIQAFIDVNVSQAREIAQRDDEIDHRYRTVFTALIAMMTQEPGKVPYATSLLFTAHDLERIGDRVTNICEDIIYMVTSEVEELN